MWRFGRLGDGGKLEKKSRFEFILHLDYNRKDVIFFMIKKALIGIALNGFALYGVTYFLEEVSYTGGLKFFIFGGIVMGLLNTFVKPLMKILSFPFIFLTGGVFLIVINVILLAFMKYFLGVMAFPDVSFQIQGAGNFLMAGLLFGIINWAQHLVISNK